MRFEGHRIILGCIAIVVLIAIAAFFFSGLSPASASSNNPPVVFEITSGQGFRTIIGNLKAQGLIKSSLAVETFSLVNGTAFHMQPGLYKLDANMSAPAILGAIANGTAGETTVTIPEGADIYQIDTILSNALVIQRGDLINFTADGNLEGKLFPDTYRFYIGASTTLVVQKLLDNFNVKAEPILATDPTNATFDLIVASMVEKEVPDPTDQKIVAGIIYKRLKAGVALDIDATLCYAMQQNQPLSVPDCGALDLQINSPYNTYLHKGLPPGPIGNPGISALEAAVSPESSPYWYYLSDPKTGKTIFAQTLDEQHQNEVKYLKGD